MEAFGMALYGLLGLAAAPLFCYAVLKFIRPMPRLAALCGGVRCSRWYCCLPWPLIAAVGWIVGVAAIFYQQDVADALSQLALRR